VLSGSATGAERTGLTIAAGVNNVTMTQSGSSVTGFVGNGVVLQGGSRASAFANFAISGNGQSGIVVLPGDTTGTVIRNSTISGNGFNGVWLNGATPSVKVTGNTLTNNNNNGIVVSGPASNVVIRKNTVTSSGLTGIRTEVVAGQAPSNMRISGNTTRLNQENGIIIAGNTGTTISGNVVADNRLQGIVLVLGATRTSITSNQIYNNGAVGVVVSDATTVGNPILSNSIYGNRRGGIVLLDGGNLGQVSPTLTSARLGGGNITIAGTITGNRDDVFRIQYFSSTATDATSGSNVQGRTLIGQRDITLTGKSASINAILSAAGIPKGSWISATATRLVGGVPSNTSQFSLGVKAT
ncbi:MAG: right-handed parallel beta-helix repeat-containing protein, partial [Planctomycetota bacterium]